MRKKGFSVCISISVLVMVLVSLSYAAACVTVASTYPDSFKKSCLETETRTHPKFNVILNFSNQGEKPLNITYNICASTNHLSDTFWGKLWLRPNESKEIGGRLGLQKNNLSIHSNVKFISPNYENCSFNFSFKAYSRKSGGK